MWGPRLVRVLGEEPPLDARRHGPRATPPTLGLRVARLIHPEGMLLRILPPHKVLSACTPSTRSTLQHRCPPHEQPLECWATCARLRWLQAQQNLLLLAEVHAHILLFVVERQASAPCSHLHGTIARSPGGAVPEVHGEYSAQCARQAKRYCAMLGGHRAELRRTWADTH